MSADPANRQPSPSPPPPSIPLELSDIPTLGGLSSVGADRRREGAGHLGRGFSNWTGGMKKEGTTGELGGFSGALGKRDPYESRQRIGWGSDKENSKLVSTAADAYKAISRNMQNAAVEKEKGVKRPRRCNAMGVCAQWGCAQELDSAVAVVALRTNIFCLNIEVFIDVISVTIQKYENLLSHLNCGQLRKVFLNNPVRIRIALPIIICFCYTWSHGRRARRVAADSFPASAFKKNDPGHAPFSVHLYPLSNPQILSRCTFPATPTPPNLQKMQKSTAICRVRGPRQPSATSISAISAISAIRQNPTPPERWDWPDYAIYNESESTRGACCTLVVEQTAGARAGAGHLGREFSNWTGGMNAEATTGELGEIAWCRYLAKTRPLWVPQTFHRSMWWGWSDKEKLRRVGRVCRHRSWSFPCHAGCSLPRGMG
ncbi:hypothetical protein EDC01DRAFT_632563 [Geopyxis carbonaria]|nr:hypothetical protein EDC01DRAFT_632563 [Geopyxis carbonaria]